MTALSPKTSTIRSETPLITSGCAPKSGAVFTMSNALALRRTRFGSPSSSFIVETNWMPVSRAASYSSPTDKSVATLPVTIVPSGRNGPFPERYSKSPVRPLVSFSCTSEPASSRTRIASTMPRQAARCRGVSPDCVSIVSYRFRDRNCLSSKVALATLASYATVYIPTLEFVASPDKLIFPLIEPNRRANPSGPFPDRTARNTHRMHRYSPP